jgi:hypothetical protein
VITVPEFIENRLFRKCYQKSVNLLCSVIITFLYIAYQDIYCSDIILFSGQCPFCLAAKMFTPWFTVVSTSVSITIYYSLHNRHLSHAANRLNHSLRGKIMRVDSSRKHRQHSRATSDNRAESIAGQWQLRRNGISQAASLDDENEALADCSGERPDKLHYCAQPITASCFHASVPPPLKIR